VKSRRRSTTGKPGLLVHDSQRGAGVHCLRHNVATEKHERCIQQRTTTYDPVADADQHLRALPQARMPTGRQVQMLTQSQIDQLNLREIHRDMNGKNRPHESKKVSVELELSKPAQQMVVNEQ
jgi:hypothetical protein